MGMAVARIAAGPPSVKCRICGRATARTSKLCDQCVAAVKRARQVPTIASQFLPQPVPDIESQARASRSRSALRRRSSRWSWLPTKPGAWGVVVAVMVFGAAVGVTGYLAVQEIAEKAVLIAIPLAAPDSSGSRASVAPADESAETSGPTSSFDAIVAPTSDVAPIIAEPAQQTVPPQKSVLRRPTTENRIGKGGAAPADRRAPDRIGESDQATDTAESATPAQTVARAPIPQEAPAADRWETMNGALANCSRENFLAGVVCTERVRLQYCEGFWGQVPQCKGATRPGNPR
jgi:hypothetical protein